MFSAQGHALGMYNLAMMHLAKDPSSCSTALELLKKVAGAAVHSLRQTNCGVTCCLKCQAAADRQHFARAWSRHILHAAVISQLHDSCRSTAAGRSWRSGGASPDAAASHPAEKGPWAGVLQEGREAFADGDFDGALLAYLRAAEMGLELGQSNAAWLITHVRAPWQHSVSPSSVLEEGSCRIRRRPWGGVSQLVRRVRWRMTDTAQRLWAGPWWCPPFQLARWDTAPEPSPVHTAGLLAGGGERGQPGGGAAPARGGAGPHARAARRRRRLLVGAAMVPCIACMHIALLAHISQLSSLYVDPSGAGACMPQHAAALLYRSADLAHTIAAPRGGQPRSSAFQFARSHAVKALL